MTTPIRILAFGVKFLPRIVFSNPSQYDVEYYSCSRADRALTSIPTQARLLQWRDVASIARNVRQGAYDLVICEEIRHPAWAARQSLADRWSRAKQLIVNPERYGPALVGLLRGIPIAVVDLSDCNLLAVRNRKLLEVATCYFKRELPVNPVLACMLTDKNVMHVRQAYAQKELMGWLHKLRPLSIGLHHDAAKLLQEMGTSQTKQYDVFYSGSAHRLNALRSERFTNQLRALRDEGYRVLLPETMLPLRDFLEACARSWLVWSPQGEGWDCYRHYEAAAAGSIPVINYPSIRRYAPMLHGVHAFFYDPTGENLRETIADALRDKPKLIKMSEQARALVAECHTQQKQLDHIVDECLDMTCGNSRPDHAILSTTLSDPQR